MLLTKRGLNPQPPDHQSDVQQTEPLRLAWTLIYPGLANSVDPDQLASKKPTDLDLHFAIQYVNL